MVARFERMLLDALQPGRAERFELPAHRLAALTRVLERAAEGPDADAEIDRALRLVVALKGRLASPTAAERLRSVLRAVPAVKAHLKAKRRRRDIDQMRGFLAREGRAAPLVAPAVAAPGGPDALTIADFHHRNKARRC